MIVPNKINTLSRVKLLNLPVGEYVVFGSGVLEVHGIRAAKDVDVLITNELYKKLEQLGWKRKWFFRRFFICKALKKGDNEAFTNMHWGEYKPDTESIIKSAEYFDGIPFLPLIKMLEWKSLLPREKDKKDVDLIVNYLKSNEQTNNFDWRSTNSR